MWLHIYIELLDDKTNRNLHVSNVLSQLKEYFMHCFRFLLIFDSLSKTAATRIAKVGS